MDTSKRGNRGLQSKDWHRLSGITTSCCSIAPFILAAAFVWPFGAKKIEMMAGAQAPAAHGQVIVKNGPNGNIDLDIRAAALAKPTSLAPPENVYLVWLQQPGQQPQNLGELRVDNKLKGSLHTVTPYKRFKIFITAEQNMQEQSPEGAQVLSAEVAGAAA